MPTSSKTAWKKTDAGEGERPVAKEQTSKDLVSGYKRLDKAGHGGCILAGH